MAAPDLVSLIGEVAASSEEYEILVVRYGSRETVRSDVYLNYGVYRTPDGPIGMDYFFWVLRSPNRTVVVDSGFGEQGGRRRARTTVVDPVEAFTALGVRPSESPVVVVTHAHYDHIGNLSFFPSSQVVAARAELEFWTGPQAHRPLFHHSVEDDEVARFAEVMRSDLGVLYDDSHEVADGVALWRVGGHTPGQAVVLVRTAAGVVMLASDSVHYYEELQAGLPFMSVADLVAMYGGFDLINGLLDRGLVAEVVTGHDPATLARYPLLEGLPGPLAGNVAVVGGAR